MHEIVREAISPATWAEAASIALFTAWIILVFA